MQVLFVYSVGSIESPAKPLGQPEEINFGISYISAVLKRAGHPTRLVVLSSRLGDQNRERLEEALKQFQPGLICFGAVSTEYPFIASQAAYIKKHYPGIFLMIGGPHVSLNPANIFADAFDALCVGEGEYPTLELVEQLEKGQTPAGIPNLWFKRNGAIEQNPTRRFLQDLDSLPFPDRALWSEWIAEGLDARYAVLLARGCPFNCTYCCNHALRKLAAGRYVRFRSPSNIVAEIQEIARAGAARKEIYLEVETLGADRAWARDLFTKLKELNQQLPVPLTYGANFRVTPGVDFSDLFAAARDANFRFINIGLESGSDRLRREVMGRQYANEDILRTVQSARRHGLQIAFFNMIGLPTETPAEFQQTIDINRQCQPDWHMTSIFYPYPGTDLDKLCRERGLLSAASLESTERVTPVLDMPQFPSRQVQQGFVWFDWYVYRGVKPWYKLLMKVAAARLKTWPKLHDLYRRLTKNPCLKKIKHYLKA